MKYKFCQLDSILKIFLLMILDLSQLSKLNIEADTYEAFVRLTIFQLVHLPMKHHQSVHHMVCLITKT